SVRDLTVYRASGSDAEVERVFDGDAAVKLYRVRGREAGFEIEEGLPAPFRPFVLIRVSCQANACAAHDQRCLWRKTKPEKADAPWTRNFIAALSGDENARRLFDSEQERSELFYTYRADLLRLKTLGCLR